MASVKRPHMPFSFIAVCFASSDVNLDGLAAMRVPPVRLQSIAADSQRTAAAHALLDPCDRETGQQSNEPQLRAVRCRSTAHARGACVPAAFSSVVAVPRSVRLLQGRLPR